MNATMMLHLPEQLVEQLKKQPISSTPLNEMIVEWLKHWLNRQAGTPKSISWPIWQRQAQALAAQILQRRSNNPIDVDILWTLTRQDLETKHDDCFSN